MGRGDSGPRRVLPGGGEPREPGTGWERQPGVGWVEGCMVRARGERTLREVPVSSEHGRLFNRMRHLHRDWRGKAGKCCRFERLSSCFLPRNRHPE